MGTGLPSTKRGTAASGLASKAVWRLHAAGQNCGEYSPSSMDGGYQAGTGSSGCRLAGWDCRHPKTRLDGAPLYWEERTVRFGQLFNLAGMKPRSTPPRRVGWPVFSRLYEAAAYAKMGTANRLPREAGKSRMGEVGGPPLSTGTGGGLGNGTASPLRRLSGYVEPVGGAMGGSINGKFMANQMVMRWGVADDGDTDWGICVRPTATSFPPEPRAGMFGGLSSGGDRICDEWAGRLLVLGSRDGPDDTRGGRR